MIQLSMTTTKFDLDGFRIIRNLGVVRGITVRSRSIVGSFIATIETIFGGNISMYTELCERTRFESFNLMLEHAEKLGANAIIGIRYDTTEIMSGVSEVLCYGTAVFADRIK